MNKTISILASGMVLLATSSVFAKSDSNQKVMELSDVQAMLSANKELATWTPKETWVSQLSVAEAKRMMGVKRKIPGGQLNTHSPIRGNETVDWRNMNGVNYLGTVMNQGNCGSCVAFAAVATLEAQTTITTGATWMHPSFSAQALFACGGGGCDSGWYPDSAVEYLQDRGAADNACMPYTSGSTGKDAKCSSACSDVASRSMKIKGSDQPSSSGPFGGSSGSIDAVKKALKKGPMITTLSVYGDFVTYGGGVYRHVGGKALGGHAVSLVGYSDEKRAWLIRNSWGEEWGEHGFGWISWDDTSGVADETWSLDVGANAPGVAVTYPLDRSYVSGNVNFTASMGTKTMFAEPVKFVVTADSGNAVQTLDCGSVSASSCQANVDTTAMKEGHYTIMAQGKETGAKSQTREFYVINSEPKMSLSFKGASGVDLTKPLDGRPEFVITATSSPVPMQHIVLQVLDASGKVVSSKDNPDVLPVNQMGWRTVTVKDGKYSMRIHGEMPYNGKLYAVDSASVPITVHTTAGTGNDPAK